MVPLSAVHNGNYLISSQLDIDALAGIRVITGELRVSTPSFDVLALPDLEIVGGNFFIYDFNGGRLTQISMPKLESVGGTVEWTALKADLIGLPKLESVGRDFQIGVRTAASNIPCLQTIPDTLSVIGTPELTEITFDRLAQVAKVSVSNNAQLTSISLPAVTSAANFDVHGNAKLVSIDASTIVQGGELRFQDNPLLAQLHFDNLTSATLLVLTNVADVTGFAKLESLSGLLQIDHTAATTLATFSTLTSAGMLIVTYNAQLTNLGLTSLTTLTTALGGYYGQIVNNPMLPTCQAVALSNQVMKPFNVAGNDDAGVCP